MSSKLLSQGGDAGGSDVSEEAPVRGRMRAHVMCGGGKRTGSGSCRPSAAGRGRASGTCIACGLGMDTRILPLERKALYLGCWTLGSATPASRSLDPRPMGSSRWRLGLDQRLLALTSAARLPSAEAGMFQQCNERPHFHVHDGLGRLAETLHLILHQVVLGYFLQSHVEHVSPPLQKISSGILPDGGSFLDGHRPGNIHHVRDTVFPPTTGGCLARCF
jgi:hypothetical protein